MMVFTYAFGKFVPSYGHPFSGNDSGQTKRDRRKEPICLLDLFLSQNRNHTRVEALEALTHACKYDNC
jgi:hypothetical protein